MGVRKRFSVNEDFGLLFFAVFFDLTPSPLRLVYPPPASLNGSRKNQLQNARKNQVFARPSSIYTRYTYIMYYKKS